jgi:putative transposase
MAQLSHRRHRFSGRDHSARDLALFPLYPELPRCEELPAERGFDVSYETVRRWVLKFGPLIARKLRKSRPRPSARWHLRRDGRPHRRETDVSVARR